MVTFSSVYKVYICGTMKFSQPEAQAIPQRLLVSWLLQTLRLCTKFSKSKNSSGTHFLIKSVPRFSWTQLIYEKVPSGEITHSFSLNEFLLNFLWLTNWNSTALFSWVTRDCSRHYRRLISQFRAYPTGTGSSYTHTSLNLTKLLTKLPLFRMDNFFAN